MITCGSASGLVVPAGDQRQISERCITADGDRLAVIAG
jgi:hypothetical protein